MTVRDNIKQIIRGDVSDIEADLETASRDTSIFKRRPELVVFPKNASDVAALVRYVYTARTRGEDISVTARSAGTDMSGGSLTDSIVVSFTKYMNHIQEIGSDYAITEPGVYYRDFEKATLAKNGKILPSYPASRELCAVGGIVSNNSGGELTLHYGKTDRYVQALDVVLSDGTETTFAPLDSNTLKAKIDEETFEGEVYRKMHTLITENTSIVEAAKPKVSKNSSGYALWDVVDKEKGTFDLSKLIVGSQGTLALVTRAKLGLMRRKKHRAMLVVFMKDLAILPEVVRRVLTYNPESFESYDDHTFKLAIRLLPQMLKDMGLLGAAGLGLSFLPEVGLVLTGGVPKLVLMAEFSEDSDTAAHDHARAARESLKDIDVQTKIALGELGTRKYWKVRREAFAILRKKLPGLTAAPFIDDFVVNPDTYPEFLPKLFSLLDAEGFRYAVTGHIGNGNFHIFPLVDLAQPDVHTMILSLSEKVYTLVSEYHGSITGEHNDGIIRTPYVKDMFGPDMHRLFEQTKAIFDPKNVFNPGKKVGGTIADIERFMLKTSK